MSAFAASLLISSIVVALTGGLGIVWLEGSRERSGHVSTVPITEKQALELVGTLSLAVSLVVALISHVGN